ncbi:hypothetical protein HY632_03405 [Candidatus Uhrbacteria bacterium]|nr:hypothetical protein [Candidatus Uhrbacteria bacterium]
MAKSSHPATQRYLDIAEIREDAVIMGDGTLRAVLAVSSINFALKSEEEQEAVIAQYVQFLNTLDVPLEIVIHSRHLDIDPYLNKLRDLEKTQPNELLKVQMAEYRKFVGELVSLGDIMTKTFYVVVLYSPFSDRRKSFFDRLGEAFSPAKGIRLQGTMFAERREQLFQRVSSIAGSLQSMGLKSVVLDTQALIELFYRLYNPMTATNEKLVDLKELRVEA